MYSIDGGSQQIDLVLPTAAEDQIPMATIHYIHFNDNDIHFSSSGADRDSNGVRTVKPRWYLDSDDELLSEAEQFTLAVEDLSAGNHTVFLEVQDNEGNWSPATTYSLSKMEHAFAAGWQDISLPALLSGGYDTKLLMETIEAQDGCPVEMAQWTGNNWNSSLATPPYFTKPVSAEHPFFIKTSCDSELVLISNQALQDNAAISLEISWNFQTYPATAPTLLVADACTQINQQGGQVKEIVRWDPASANWSSHICGLPFTNFELAPGGNYFIQSESSSTWIPQVSPSMAGAMQSRRLNPQTQSAIHKITQLDRTAQNQIDSVQITNLGSKRASVSWLTESAAGSLVRYGTDVDSLINETQDDRGAAYAGATHHVTLSGLAPETTYFFSVESGGIVDDNEGQFYQFTTAPTPSSVPASDPVFGQIFDTDGTTPLENILVYLQIVDNDGTGNGQSSLLSGVTDETGFWLDGSGNPVQLSTARTESGDSPFAYSPTGDLLQLEAYGGIGCTASTQVDTGADTPAESVTLVCDMETPPTNIPTATPTHTLTATATDTAAATLTTVPEDTPTHTPTATDTPMPTSTLTSTPVPAAQLASNIEPERTEYSPGTVAVYIIQVENLSRVIVEDVELSVRMPQGLSFVDDGGPEWKRGTNDRYQLAIGRVAIRSQKEYTLSVVLGTDLTPSTKIRTQELTLTAANVEPLTQGSGQNIIVGVPIAIPQNEGQEPMRGPEDGTGKLYLPIVMQ